MPGLTRTGWLTAIALLLSATCGFAQELSVYTQTSELGSAGNQPQVVAKSLTLFHAGKVYDWIDSQREVTIYEPVARKFTVLQLSTWSAAEVTQDEVRHYLSVAEEQALETVSLPSTSPAAALEFLKFQLKPEFAVREETAAKRLWLSSPKFRYEIEGFQPPEPAVVEAYLKYADAIAELNAVLHPHAVLPGPRLELNRELRQRQLLPITVRRTIEADRKVDLRADHEWKWSLGDYDRQKIAYWDGELRKPTLRRLTFKQLQQEVLRGGKVAQR
jgi:hypothetical protein